MIRRNSKRVALCAFLVGASFALDGCVVGDIVKILINRLVGPSVAAQPPPPARGPAAPSPASSPAASPAASPSPAGGTRTGTVDTGATQLGGAVTAPDATTLKGQLEAVKIRMGTLQSVIVKIATLMTVALGNGDQSKCEAHVTPLNAAGNRAAEQSVLDGKNPEQLVAVIAAEQAGVDKMGDGEKQNAAQDVRRYDDFIKSRYRAIMRTESAVGVGACSTGGLETAYSNDPTVNGMRILAYFDLLTNTCLEKDFAPAGDEELAVILREAKALKACRAGK